MSNKTSSNKFSAWTKKQALNYWKIIKDEFRADTPWLFVKNLMLVIIGTAVVSLANALFYIPLNIVAGGVSGLGIVFGSAFSFLSTEVWITILTWVMFFVGWILLGFKFTINTLISTIFYPIFIFIFSYLTRFQVLDITTYLTNQNVNESKEYVVFLLGAIFGGGLTGIGVAITFLGGGSTGGIDCICLSLQKYLKLKASIGSFFVDLTVILLGFIVTKDFIHILIAICAVIICSIIIDKVFIGGSQNYLVMIVSPHYKSISHAINYQMDRGTTLLKSVGGFSGKEGYTVKVCIHKKQYHQLVDIVHSIDKKAFVTVMQADQIRGDGFEDLETKKKYFSLKRVKNKDVVPLEMVKPLTDYEKILEDQRIAKEKEEKK